VTVQLTFLRKGVTRRHLDHPRSIRFEVCLAPVVRYALDLPARKPQRQHQKLEHAAFLGSSSVVSGGRWSRGFGLRLPVEISSAYRLHWETVGLTTMGILRHKVLATQAGR
jgi:hypothetical protein